MKKIFINKYLLIAVVLFFPIIVLAEEASPIYLQVAIPGVGHYVKDLNQYIRVFYSFFIPAAGVLSAVMIVFGGFRWLTAAGSPQAISEAKETVISAVMGLILALTSYVLLNTINPAITRLDPLVVPIVQQAEGSTAKAICNNSVVDNDGDPIKCGTVVWADLGNDNSKCLGVYAEDRPGDGKTDYCKVFTNNTGDKTGQVDNSVLMIPATYFSSAATAWAMDDDDCGVLRAYCYYNPSLGRQEDNYHYCEYTAGTKCDVGSTHIHNVCYIDSTANQGTSYVINSLDPWALLSGNINDEVGAFINMQCQTQ